MIEQGVKVNKIFVECKKSHKFQTYTVAAELDVSEKNMLFGSEDFEALISRGQAVCRRKVLEQIEVDAR